jgi:Uncharacterized protein conserved in bacteria (DUF2066)
MLNRPVLYAAIAALGFFVLGTTAEAMRNVRVYDVSVPSTGATAFGDAMRIAIVRATGDRNADDDPALRPLIDDARRYAQVVRPVAAGGTQVNFDGGAVDRALVAAGRSLWPRDRPVVLLVAEGEALSAEQRRELELHAEDRGLPLVLGSAGQSSAGNRDAALAAARSAAADYLLVAQPVGAQYSLRLWVPESLESRLPATRWTSDLLDGLDGVADAVAASSIGLSVQPELETDVAVSGVASLRDYADVVRSLTAIPGVKAVQLLEISSTGATWRLVVRGGDETVQSALAANARFNPAAGGAARLSYAWQR